MMQEERSNDNIKNNEKVGLLDDMEVGNASNGDTTDSMIPQASTGMSSSTKKRTKTIVKAGKIVKKKLVKKKVSSKKTSATEHSAIIKYGALVLLIAQMVGLVLLMRYTRTHAAPGQQVYLSSVAVFFMECLKFVICCTIMTYQSPSGNFIYELQRHTWQVPTEVAKLSVPAFLYTIQNNLLYLALSYLDAATYQVCYQLKILTTALFSVIMLQRQFSALKWISLVILTVGVAIVQVSGSGDKHHHATGADQAHRLMGLVAVLCAACTSGFAGVYFEKILKSTAQTSLWIRNIQMGLPSCIIALVTVFVHDYATVVNGSGMMVGFTSLVWTVIVVQAVGGLIVAVVVKYADNVLKVFATSMSIVLNCLISAIWFDFQATWLFVVGASLVVLATVLYSLPGGKTKTPRKQGNTGATAASSSSKNGSAAGTILPLTTAGHGKDGAPVAAGPRVL